MAPPAPLRSNNLFLVDAKGKPERAADARDLEAWFRSSLAPVRDEKAAKDAVRAWLRLAQEMVQDGYYQFTTPDELVSAGREGGRLRATGRSLVTGGGRGEISVAMTFDASGKLDRVTPAERIMHRSPAQVPGDEAAGP